MVVWNTGSAAARFRLKNKKKIKPQAPSGKLRAPACGHTSPTRNRLELQATSRKRQATSNKRLTGPEL